MTSILLILLIALALFSLLTKDLLHSVIALSAISLLSSLIFVLHYAFDVAITEAAVGAGITTIIFVWALRHTSRRDV